MKTVYKAALAAICLLGAVGIAQADRRTDESPSTSAGTPSDAAISATAVGGVPSAGSQAGGPAGLTRAQVRQELIRAQRSGELDRLNQFYGGGQ
ncbi:DUF4148 domain-containing protein [Burkholderia sp. Bp9012]|uniref:DUF4148 domain-containing protein n=1 Tax=Burkholderia sp. Bp9012 TaxID=2184562 RepID=UPI000F5AC086|nr:DUF4148 domain-containing protein [Burkholderia sp. Bp9012]RQR71583.1 DUF4148 domain-containing protein [Burkholderia sp. Bp9012]